MANDPPGHPIRPATTRRVAARSHTGGAKSECYTTTATTPGRGQIKGEQWGHFRVLRPDMALKQRALDRTTPPATPPGRYQPPDQLLAFLEAL